MTPGIATAHSTHPDTSTALDEVAAGLSLDSAAFTLLLHGPNHTGNTLESHLEKLTGGQVFGCSTSGEIVPSGYCENSLAAICFDRAVFTCVSRKIDRVGQFGFQQAKDLVLSMQRELRESVPQPDSSNTFALLLIDSMSQAEEMVVAALGNELGTIHLVGGSSGDNWQVARTPVLYQGKIIGDSAVVLLVHSKLDFRHYNFHNFMASDKRGVITAATPARRLVHEINGVKAVEEYARLCSISEDALVQEILAMHPAIITVGDRPYPRGFMQILKDGSLQSACAIDEGVVFRVPTQLDYVGQLKEAFARMRQELGEQLLVLGFECAGRKQLVQQKQLEAEVFALFSENNVWGFSCMGEQSNSINMNHSFNCLAFKLPS
ncbi:MAG: FIST N-terminal domain-containing protein [Pseudomonadota bacterium]